MATPKYLSGNKEAIQGFLDQFDDFLFDCDGKRIVFVTNNSTKSRAEYKKKLDNMGIPCSVDEIFGSSYSAAIYISRILKPPAPRNKTFILGEYGIEAELASESLPYTGGTDPSLRRDMTPADYTAIASGDALDPEVGVVLCGLDFHINYLKLALAHAYLVRGATFLATNTDGTLPASGAFFPGAGSVSAPLVKALGGREPVALGKPSQAMMQAVEGKFHFDKSRTCMIGDRLNTDIQFGIEGGLGGTLAVLTGVCKRGDFEGKTEGVRPAAFVDRLADLLLVGE
ncbi:MAG: hypothetical protein M1819_006413 [Sarea resinae]|nr:MAG: hypothetical protein M1819_006413 [Sarea resinae]